MSISPLLQPGSVELRYPARSSLEVEVTRAGDTVLIRLRGNLDDCGRHLLDRALADSEASDAHRIRLDIDGLSLIDAAGLSALLRASRRSAADGHRLRLTRGSGDVAQMLRLTALDLSIHFDERGAIGASR